TQPRLLHAPRVCSGEGGLVMEISHPRLLPLGLAALAPVAAGGILAARVADSTPLVAAPAITFGVLPITSPAPYIATPALGEAPPPAHMVRALAPPPPAVRDAA